MNLDATAWRQASVVSRAQALSARARPGVHVQRRRRVEWVRRRGPPVTAPAFTVVEKVLRAHGLPEMRRNAPDRLGGSRIRRDFENTEFGVVAEVDGVLGHDGFGRTLDARRDRKTLATGRVTARQTWVEVHYQSCELAADLLGILRSRRARRGIPAVHADLLGPPAPRRAPDLVRSLTVAMAAATLLTTPPSRLSDRRSSR